MTQVERKVEDKKGGRKGVHRSASVASSTASVFRCSLLPVDIHFVADPDNFIPDPDPDLISKNIFIVIFLIK